LHGSRNWVFNRVMLFRLTSQERRTLLWLTALFVLGLIGWWVL